MPELNRDRERLYAPGRLSVWFLVASVALFASLVWMVFQDYARPWKGTQKDFYKKRAEILEAKRQEARGELQGEERRKRVVDLGTRLRRAREAVEGNPEVPRLRETARVAREREKDIEAKFKVVSGTWAEKRYEVERVRQQAAHGHASQADVAGAEAEYERLDAERAELERQRATPVAEALAAERRLGELEKERKDLEKEFAKERQTFTGHETALADARAKGESAWRNAFGIDFLVPTIVPRKVVNENVHDDFNFATSAKVDMCMSCHMGADDPLMVDAHRKFRADKVFEAHPHLDLLMGPNSPHPMNAIGCTVCHAGRGWSLDFLRAAHTPRDAAQRKEWEEKHDWSPARWVDFPMLPLPYVEGQCFKCHAEGLYYPPQVFREETGRAHVEFERLDRYVLETGKADGPDAKTPAKNDDGTLRPKMLETRATETRPAEALYPLLAKAPQPMDDRKALGGLWHPERLERGMEVATEYGCYGCHIVKDFPRLPGFRLPPSGGKKPAGTVTLPATAAARGGSNEDLAAPAPGTLINGLPKVGWDLTRVGHKVTLDWMRRWIRSPNTYRIDTRMPSFYWFREHDDAFVPTRGADGKPVDRPVEESPDERDLLETDVEVEALAVFLKWQSDQHEAPRWPKPPEGDPKLGSKTFFTAGCYGCHVGPSRWDETQGAGGAWVEDDGRRFALRKDEKGNPELPQGPRLTALGSKLADAGWLYDWLREPRHWWSTTRMPNMRWRDVLGADGKTVERTADQVRADVVAFLMQGRDAEFEALTFPTADRGWLGAHSDHLDAMYREFFGKGTDPDAFEHRLKGLGAGPAKDARPPADPKTETVEVRHARMGKLAAVGEKVVTFRGCFGCHAIPGTEGAQPIGKDLSPEGSQDIHKFDFGFLHHELEHTRWAWIEKKVHEPRAFDRGRIKLWTEKLKMPKFNVREGDRTALTAFVLGLVKEPIKPGAMYRPDDAEREILAGRAVISRYGCNQCHTIEGLKGVVFGAEEKDHAGWMLPPNLFGEGNRVRADWLFQFLKSPHDLRPGVLQRMPNFRLSDEEASALVGYFVRLAGREDRTTYDALDVPLDATPYAEPVTAEIDRTAAGGGKTSVTVRNRVEEAKALFEAHNCVTCHLRRGTPGADPTKGGQAPPFELARPRLRREWVHALLNDPQTQIQGTNMPQFWQTKGKRKVGDTRVVAYPQFRFGLPATATNDEVADAQMAALARYVIHHYDATPRAPSAPAGH